MWIKVIDHAVNRLVKQLSYKLSKKAFMFEKKLFCHFRFFLLSTVKYSTPFLQ